MAETPSDSNLNTERKLSNKDFREIALTARSTRAIDPKEIHINEKTKKFKLKQPYLHKIKERPNKKPKAEDVPQTPYRDRAKERREGLATEEFNIKELSKIAVIPDTEIDQSIESFQDQTDKIKISHALSSNFNEQPKESFINVITDKIEEGQHLHNSIHKIFPADESIDLANIKFGSILARNLFNILFNKNYQNEQEKYLPGRTILVYNVNNEHNESLIPIISTRNNMKPSILEEKSYINVSNKFIAKLNQIFAYLRGEVKNPSSKSIETSVETNKPKADIGIYDEDVGEYDPTVAIENYHIEKQIKQGSYFDKFIKTIDVQKADKTTLIKELIDSDRIKKAEQKPPQKHLLTEKLEKLTAGSENYLECYQPFDDTLKTVLDSDEEDNKIDLDSKKSLVNPWDFANPEEYQKYLETKKQVSKGIRQSRKKQPDKKKNKQSSDKVKAKLDKEWDKINLMMSERKTTAKFDGAELTHSKKKP